MFRSTVSLALLLLIATYAAAENLTVLPKTTDGQPTRKMLQRHLLRKANDALDLRRAAYEKLKTPEQVKQYQQRMRNTFQELLGPMPEKSPLMAEVVGRLEFEEFRIEKVIYQTQPNYFVTANVYVPKSKGKHPGVLIPCGHTRNGKVGYQQHCILLARHGFVVLCYDPIGQGERYQILDNKGKPVHRSTSEHSIVGAGSAPVGRSAALYRIWDGLRSLDYLANRDEVDALNLGVTGSSGGGLMTSYIMALDSRVKCAAPSCYLTTFRRLLATIGPQDAEQNVHGQLAVGLDQPDYVLLRAPRPTLILAATQDFFDIGGTWDNFRQSKRIYTRLGFAERVNLVEVDAKHGYNALQRVSMLRWMRRWLMDRTGPVKEVPFEKIAESDLTCTPQGQVLLLENARSTIDLNVELAKKLAEKRKSLWSSTDKRAALAQVRKLSGIRPLAKIPETRIENFEKIAREQYSIQKISLAIADDLEMPGLLFVPEKVSGKRILYLHEDGKHVDAAEGGAIEKLVAAGNVVLAMDLRGVGETGSGGAGQWGGGWDVPFLAYLMGHPLAGSRAEDILVATRWLGEQKIAGAEKKVHVVAQGVTAIPALHAVALEQGLFAHADLTCPIKSWTEFVAHPETKGQMVNTVLGALNVYDLPELVNSLPKGMVKFSSPGQ